MSAESVGWVFRHSPFEGATFAVHLAIADSANDQNEYEIWTAVATIAKKSRTSPSTVKTALQRLLAGQFLELVETATGRGRTNRYRLLMPSDVEVVYEQSWRARQPRESSQPPATSAGESSQPTEKVANLERESGQPPATEPKKNPSKKPKEERARALAALADMRGTVESAATKEAETEGKLKARADRVTRTWWEATFPRPNPRGGFVAARQIVKGFLASGWTDEQVLAALPECDGNPVNWKLEQALRNPKRPARSSQFDRIAEHDAAKARG